MLRLWEWERLRDLPFQIDLWLPADSDFLYVGIRVRNPHDRTVPAYWWSNIAVPETDAHPGARPRRRRLALRLRAGPSHVPVRRPELRGGRPQRAPDITYTTRAEHAADYFFDIRDDDRRWITALDGEGHGLVQTSTDLLRGRKLFLWGRGRGGRRWQEWLTEPGTGGYLEIQAGLARTQLEHIPMPAGLRRSPGWRRTARSTPTRRCVHGDGLGRRPRRGRAAGWRRRCRAPPSTPPTPTGSGTPTPTPRACWPPAPAGAPWRPSAAASGCPARRSTRPRSARPRSRGGNCCWPGVFPGPAAGAAARPRPGLPAVARPAGVRRHLPGQRVVPRLPPRHRPVGRRRPRAGRPQLGALARRPPLALGAARPRRRRGRRGQRPSAAAERYLAAWDCLRGTSSTVPGGPTERRGRPGRAAGPASSRRCPCCSPPAGPPTPTGCLPTRPRGGTAPLDGGRIRLLRARTALARGDAAARPRPVRRGFRRADLREGARGAERHLVRHRRAPGGRRRPGRPTRCAPRPPGAPAARRRTTSGCARTPTSGTALPPGKRCAPGDAVRPTADGPPGRRRLLGQRASARPGPAVADAAQAREDGPRRAGGR